MMTEEEKMLIMLGLDSAGFSSTKGKQVEDNVKSAAKGYAHKGQKVKYRQYMNRKSKFAWYSLTISIKLVLKRKQMRTFSYTLKGAFKESDRGKGGGGGSGHA